MHALRCGDAILFDSLDSADLGHAKDQRLLDTRAQRQRRKRAMFARADHPHFASARLDLEAHELDVATIPLQIVPDTSDRRANAVIDDWWLRSVAHAGEPSVIVIGSACS